MEYFNKEYLAYREIMGSTKYTVEQKGDAFRGLLTVYMHTKVFDKEEAETLGTTMQAISKEHGLRIAHEITKDLKKNFLAL
jgi:hypothetical protein